MITISQVVEDVISRSPFLAEVLYENVANVSSVARRIRPQVKKKLLEEVSEEAIAMALRRMGRKIKPAPSGLKFLKDLNNITVRSNLVEFVFPNSSSITKIHQDILKKIENKEDVFLNISRGLFESIIIISSDFEKDTEQILRNQSKVSKIKDLSSITIKLPEETITTPGVYYPILKALAWDGLNIIEVISIGSELSILFRSNDADRAFSVIKSLTSR